MKWFRASGLLVGAVILCAGASASARTLDVYVLTGQSNALGTVQDSALAAGTPAIGNHAAEQDGAGGKPNVPFWFDNFNGYNNTRDVELGASTGWDNLDVQPKGPYAFDFWGSEIGVSRRLYELGARDFALIKAARDGGGNTLWQRSPTRPANGTTSGAGVAYWKLIDTIQAATSPANLATIGYDDYRIVGLMYLQGESNNGAEAAAAATRFTQLLTDINSDLPGKAAGMLAAIGENLSTASTNLYGTSGWQGAQGAAHPSGVSNTNLHALVTANPTTLGWVQTSDLAICNTDNLKIHADANSQITIGARYADALVALGAPVPEPAGIALSGGALLLLARRRRVTLVKTGGIWKENLVSFG